MVSDPLVSVNGTEVEWLSWIFNHWFVVLSIIGAYTALITMRFKQARHDEQIAELNKELEDTKVQSEKELRRVTDHCEEKIKYTKDDVAGWHTLLKEGTVYPLLKRVDNVENDHKNLAQTVVDSQEKMFGKMDQFTAVLHQVSNTVGRLEERSLRSN